MAQPQRAALSLTVALLCCGLVHAALILDGPSSMAVDLGSQVTLKCRVTEQGSDPIRWFRIDTNTIISNDGKIIKRSLRKRLRIVGNRTLGEYNLYIRQVTPEDNGTYACGVLSTEEQRPIMSPPAHLAAVQKPLCEISSSKAPAPGVTVTLSCRSQNQGLDVSLSWHRPAQPDEVMEGTTDSNYTGSSRYNVLNVTLKPTDFGESYICKETHVDPQFTRGCTITPLETNLPVILFPKQMEIVQGQNATFTCIIASKNSLTYEWYINGHRDYNAQSDKYVFSPVTLASNSTTLECRTRDDVTGMTGNASAILYVYPNNVPSKVAADASQTSEDSSVAPFDGRVVDDSSTIVQRVVQDPPIGVPPSRKPTPQSADVVPNARPSLSPGESATPFNKTPVVVSSSESPSNVAHVPTGHKQMPTTAGVNKWSNMMIPVLAVGAVIALLLVFVIIVLILFLVRQNRVAHGSVGSKDSSRRNDIPMDELRHPNGEGARANKAANSDNAEVDDGEEPLGPKYFTLEHPDKRKPRRLERTCSHMIVSDSSSEYNVLCRNASLRTPAGVQQNDYARPESQISTGDGDMSTVAAYAITDVTLGGGTSSLRRSKSCLRPLPAAPIEAIMNRSHYSIPRDTFSKVTSETESSGDSITIPLRPALSDPLSGSYRRSRVAAAYVPAGDEYAEIDSPPRPASPESSDCSRPNSPDMMCGTGAKAMKELTVSLASSYESGYDAASSDYVMDSESTSPYANINVYERCEVETKESPLPDRTNDLEAAAPLVVKAKSTKVFPVYAKVKRTRSTQVDGTNIDEHREADSEIPC